MIIHAMSRLRAQRLRPNPSCALISISTPGKPYARELPTKGWLGFLALEFDDVAHQVPEHLGEPSDWLTTSFIRFNEADASRVVFAARKAADAGCKDLVIHCDAGLSRSVAIAESLRAAGLGELKLWECDKPLRANPLVLQHMRRVLVTENAS